MRGKREATFVPDNKQNLGLLFSYEFQVKKDGFFHGGGGSRNVQVLTGQSDIMQLKPSGKTLNVYIGNGLPKSSREFQSQVLHFSQLFGDITDYRHNEKRRNSHSAEDNTVVQLWT